MKFGVLFAIKRSTIDAKFYQNSTSIDSVMEMHTGVNFLPDTVQSQYRCISQCPDRHSC